MRLGVNIDHVATVRQARGGVEPDPFEAARVVAASGAHGITVHIRMDRRHIQESDIARIRQAELLPLNIEMAATEEMQAIATRYRPHKVTLVPEQPGEITTLGGLDCFRAPDAIRRFAALGTEFGMDVAVFIDPDAKQIEQAAGLGIQEIEIHTGEFAKNWPDAQRELAGIAHAARTAAALGMRVAAGHGLTVRNVVPILGIQAIEELNIGHHIISRAIFRGLEAAIREMLETIERAAFGGSRAKE
ncbi:MAG: pyridoxine 5'-phosphate synthase [Candidatus Wallbacteria bacterium]|nr:pyridoxine 5'-phosphate synthase [Candidatus Wallbacteria bacterium]